jgi:hypothetical protein
MEAGRLVAAEYGFNSCRSDGERISRQHRPRRRFLWLEIKNRRWTPPSYRDLDFMQRYPYRAMTSYELPRIIGGGGQPGVSISCQNDDDDRPSKSDDNFHLHHASGF